MPSGLSVALALLAQAAAAAPAPEAAAGYGPPPPVLPVKAPPPPAESCDAAARTDSSAIVICAPKPQGYRIDPDVLAAERAKKNGGRLKPPDKMADRSCAIVGPMGCRGGAGINILGAATTLATMAERLAKGEEIGSLFVTDPTPDEYQLYVLARKRREAAAAEAAAKAKAKAAPGAQPPAPQR